MDEEITAPKDERPCRGGFYPPYDYLGEKQPRNGSYPEQDLPEIYPLGPNLVNC
jgi:hypothetical protein